MDFIKSKYMIKVGYLISYDYEMIFDSIGLIYNDVDAIFLAIDKNLKTWSGNDIEIKPYFFKKLKELDIKNKIHFYYDYFYIPELSPMECETRERNLLLKQMGKGWLIQLDVDEYIYDFKKTAKFLKKYWFLTLLPKWTPIVFRGKLVTLFKQIPEGFLYIRNHETFPFITNTAQYQKARANPTLYNHQTNVQVIHQSWARSKAEIALKIKNWGHRDDFDTKKYFEMWQELNINNHTEYVDFHPISPKVWDNLQYLKSENISGFLDEFSSNNPQKLTNISFKKILKILLRKC